MGSFNSSGSSVLIVDPDESIRHMLSALLGRAGFRTESADQVDGDGYFDVIVRDVNLAPRERESTMQELERMAPELLRRTVIITTDPGSLARDRLAAEPFALLRKPFDVALLVETVRQCRDGATRTRNSRKQQVEVRR